MTAHTATLRRVLDEYDRLVARNFKLEAVAGAARALIAGHEKFKAEEISEGEVASSDDIYKFAIMIMGHIPRLRDMLSELDKETR